MEGTLITQAVLVKIVNGSDQYYAVRVIKRETFEFSDGDDRESFCEYFVVVSHAAEPRASLIVRSPCDRKFDSLDAALIAAKRLLVSAQDRGFRMYDSYQEYILDSVAAPVNKAAAAREKNQLRKAADYDRMMASLGESW